jgi:membrane protein required for beta-lactamase induction
MEHRLRAVAVVVAMSGTATRAAPAWRMAWAANAALFRKQ